MRGSDGGEQNLSEEKGPLSKDPPNPPPLFFSFFLLRMLPEMEGDERSEEEKNCSLYFLKIDFSFGLRGRLTGRQVVDWIEGEGEPKVEGRLFQTQKQMKELLFFWKTDVLCTAHTNQTPNTDQCGG